MNAVRIIMYGTRGSCLDHSLSLVLQPDGSVGGVSSSPLGVVRVDTPVAFVVFNHHRVSLGLFVHNGLLSGVVVLEKQQRDVSV